MVEVFKTNIEQKKVADEVRSLLLLHFPDARIHFDLEDCDRILRIEAGQIYPLQVITLLRDKNYDCEILPA